jgi:glycine/D-amino acid oxidase-like deaminating enzyme
MSYLPYAIIGGGLMGASLAYNLSTIGQKVIIVDDERTGRASSWNPGGINPLHGPRFIEDMQEFYRQSYEAHFEEHEKIARLSGIDFNWKVVKRLFLAKNSDDLRELEKTASLYREMPNFSADLLTTDDLLRFDNRISQNLEGGLLTYGNCSLNSEKFRLSLLGASVKLGAEVIKGTLTGVTTRNDSIESIHVSSNSGKISISGLVMALGSWADENIIGWNSKFIPKIETLIGDLLLVREHGAPLLADIGIGLNSVYQHDSHHYWIGGTTRKSGVLGNCPGDIRQEMLMKIRELIPGWNSFDVVAQSSAARPVTKNGLPLFGPIPDYSNAWIINGGGSKGVLMSLWMGMNLSRIMITGKVPDKLTKFLPEY